MDNTQTEFASYLKGLLGDEICKTPVIFIPDEDGNTDAGLGIVYEGKKFRLIVEEVRTDNSQK